GAAGDTAAIVKGTGRDSDDDISIKLRMITLMLQTDDCVGASFPFLSCEHDIDVGALRKLRMQGKARQTTLAMGGDLQGRIGLLGKLATGPYQADLPSPLADETATVGEKDERPGNVEARDPAFDRDARWLGDKLILHRLRHTALKGRGVSHGCLDEQERNRAARQSDQTTCVAVRVPPSSHGHHSAMVVVVQPTRV